RRPSHRSPPDVLGRRSPPELGQRCRQARWIKGNGCIPAPPRVNPPPDGGGGHRISRIRSPSGTIGQLSVHGRYVRAARPAQDVRNHIGSVRVTRRRHGAANSKEVSPMNTLDFVDQSSLRDDVPAFGPGDTVNVHVKVIEGSKERIQVFKGVVLRRQGGGV